MRRKVQPFLILRRNGFFPQFSQTADVNDAVSIVGDASLGDRSYCDMIYEGFERTAQWFLDNFHEAQLHDTLCIDLKLEWHDELTEDLARLGQQLGEREDVMAVIGPFSNDGVALLAPGCQPTHKPVIAPTATSEEIIRRFAVGTAGVENKEPFLWSLTETDITFCEVLMNMATSNTRAMPTCANG